MFGCAVKARGFIGKGCLGGGREGQFVVIYTVKAFSIANEAKIDVFLEFSCFFDDPKDVGNLHLEVCSSCIAKTWLGEFRALFYLCVR